MPVMRSGLHCKSGLSRTVERIRVEAAVCLPGAVPKTYDQEW